MSLRLAARSATITRPAPKAAPPGPRRPHPNMTPLRVIVTGGRHYSDRRAVEAELGKLPAGSVIVHGDARGADRLAAMASRRLGLIGEPHRADWDGPCRSDECRPGHRHTRPSGTSWCPMAGHYRNQEMADTGADLCIAFPGGRGTADMVRRAAAAGIEIRRVPG